MRSAGVLPSVLKRELDREGEMIDRSLPGALLLPLEDGGKGTGALRALLHLGRSVLATGGPHVLIVSPVAPRREKNSSSL